jgi:tetratricopeptide (TPR) repeat protein
MSSRWTSRASGVLAAGLILSACQSLPPQPTPEKPNDGIEAVEAPTSPESSPKPAAPPARPATDILFEKAQETARDGNHDEAITQFQQLLAMQADYPGAHTRLGLLLLQQDKADDAYKQFARAVALDNLDAIAFNHLAVIDRREGRFNAALDNYLKALEIDPDYAKAHLNIGILYDIYLARLDLALEHYQRYQDLTGNSNDDVNKWIIDLQRRIAETNKQ